MGCRLFPASGASLEKVSARVDSIAAIIFADAAHRRSDGAFYLLLPVIAVDPRD